MAQPKRRHSRTRSRLRRNAKKLAKPTLARCPECGATIEPHKACADCGAWKGRRNAIRGKSPIAAK